MFSELLEQCREVFKSADSSLKQNKETLKQSKLVFPSTETNLNIDPTKTYGNSLSFSKAQRFKPEKKEEFNLTDVSFCSSQVSLAQVDKQKCFTFTKGERFMEDKLKEKHMPQNTPLYPNYEATKKNTRQAPVMKAPINDLSKSNISVATAASLNEVGPGKYFIEKSEQQARRSAAFSKQKRFKKQQLPYEDTPLFISQNQTKKRPPTSVMKKKIAKNAKLISKQQQQEVRERMKMIYWQSIPMELDRLFKNNMGPILREKYFDIKKMTGREKRCAMLMMLDKLNFLRGGFENDIREKIQDRPGGIVYRKSTPKPFKFSEIQPGPDYYYPQDDLIKPAGPQFSFGKAGVQPEKPVYDSRDYQINEQILKKGGNIVISPIPKQHVLTIDQIHALNRGPGYYDCLFGQVQKRNDIGVVKFTQVTEKNARQNNCVDIKKDVNDAAYFPSYNAIDPNVPTFKYKEDANVQPMHLPDKVIFPEHWLFYDGDLNKVRAQIAKNVILAKNMDFQTYKKYTKRFQAFKEYLKSRQPVPEVGEYNVKFTQLDPHLEGFEMSKQAEKTLNDPITKPQGEVDGDNLILNPKDFEDHQPNIDFKKMIGRPHFQEDVLPDDEPAYGDRLLLEPKRIQSKMPAIDFNKMKGRQDKVDDIDPDQPRQGDVLKLQPKPIERRLPNIDFSKQPYKKEPQIIELDNYEQQYLEVDPKPLQRKIKGFVDMVRMNPVKMIPVLRKKDKSRQKSVTKKENSLSKASKTVVSQQLSQGEEQN